MNVRGIANRATSAINPNIAASVRVCTGYAEAAGYKRVPSYAPVVMAIVQIQALSKEDVKHLDGLNISDAVWSCFSNIQLTPVDRKDQSGGDLVTFPDPVSGRSATWLVTAMLEGWGMSGWCRAALTKQTDG